MTSDKQTPTINGLRLVSPEEAGYCEQDKDGSSVTAVITLNGKAVRYFYHGGELSTGRLEYLIPLPKPRTIRPFRRGEVKCGDVFRHKETGNDYMVIGICRYDKVWLLNEHTYTYATLLEYWHKLTYDSEGREVLSCAGVTE